MKTVFDLARKRAALSPDTTAFEELETGRRLTFAEFDDRARRLAAVLAGFGLREGDRVAVLCHNSATFFEILMACGKAGLILVPLNWRQTLAELGPILADCGATIILHDAATAALARHLGAHANGKRVAFHALDELMAKAPQAHGFDSVWSTDRVWYLLYTSGTTGKPKAVIQTVGMALANYMMIQQATALTAADSTLNFLPLFHTAGINLHSLPVFIAGGRNIILPKFELEPLVELLRRGALSLFFGVPAIYQALSLHPEIERIDLSRVRHWGCGGAPLNENLIRRFLEMGVKVCNGMGMTETGPTVFMMDAAHAVEKIGSVGRPQILAEVRLVDHRGQDVPAGESGELLFRGPGVTPGYFNNPDAAAKAFSHDGWLKSGDVGRCDADGYYYIVDRIKDMYISGGENVYPAEVEEVLANHPAILEAAVIGVTDERWGEVGAALLRLRPGQNTDAESVATFARQRLATYKVPKHVVFVDDYPRTAAGKVQKHKLRDLFLKEVAS